MLISVGNVSFRSLIVVEEKTKKIADSYPFHPD
jgi:hypothetical protein